MASRYVKQNISLAPNNASAWNYLRGILDYNHLPYARLEAFVKLYTTALEEERMDVVDLENPPPSRGANLPSAVAVEFLADIYELEGGQSIYQATEVCMLYRRSFTTRPLKPNFLVAMEVSSRFARYDTEEVSAPPVQLITC